MKACRKDIHPIIIQSSFNSNSNNLQHYATHSLRIIWVIIHHNPLHLNIVTHRYNLFAGIRVPKLIISHIIMYQYILWALQLDTPSHIL